MNGALDPKCGVVVVVVGLAKNLKKIIIKAVTILTGNFFFKLRIFVYGNVKYT